MPDKSTVPPHVSDETPAELYHNDNNASNPDPEQLLSLFPENERGVVGNVFYFVVRSGIRQPESIARSVTEQLAVNLRESSSAVASARFAAWLEVMRNHPAEAKEFARYVLWRESLPASQRAEHKARLAQENTQRHMAALPPTERQRTYLIALGYQGEIQNRFHACQLIEQLKGGGK